MGSFKVRFGFEEVYYDPEYMHIYMKIIGEADVSVDGRSGDENDIEYVRSIIAVPVREQLSALSVDKVSYKQLPSCAARFRQAAADELQKNGIVLSLFSLMNVIPTSESQSIINKHDKLKEMASMSPEELAKKAEEARLAAQRYMDSLTPEQRQRAEMEVRRKADEEARKMQEIIEQTKAVSAGASPSASPTAAAAATAAGIASLKAAAAGSRFCTNCGSPSNGGKFCSNCGSPLN